jgi:arylsulfatase A-like enzyme
MHKNLLVGVASSMLVASGAVAQTAPAGSVLPYPAAPFGGKIGTSYRDSVPDFPKPVRAPAGAPNIFLILTDDVGFGAASTFGGPIPTPNLDRLAARGLIYNRFHTTAMCSPTRAALLTGRNHHAVGNGTVANLTTGYPGYWSVLPKSAATVAEILRQNGYSTAMVGKHHNTPEDQVSAAGPFDLWPTGLGFDHFFGFMAAETNQFTPALYRGTEPVPTLAEGVLDKALADDAIDWIHQQKAAAADKPFFLYLAPGSTHAPLQAPADWIAKFRGRFDSGWDRVRADSVKRQIAAGIVPKGTRVTPRPDGIAPWDALTPNQQRVTARMMEVYAAMLSYQDAQIGRVLDEIDRMGERDNTLVMFAEGDNGASAEAGPLGGTNPMARFANGMKDGEAELLAAINSFGGPDSVGNYADGWAWAMGAPFPFFKQYASHLGGVRNGLVVSWPGRIKARGMRGQFAHVTDIVPTILEVVGLRAPTSVNGVAQQPMDGVSLAYTFAAPNVPERRHAQYFEMMGNRGIYHDGWWAGTTPSRLPWSTKAPTASIDSAKWELYDLNTDFAQANDIAATDPAKLKEMQALFDVEAKRNKVFPLDDRLDMARFQAAAAQHPVRPLYTYWGAGISVPVVSAAPIMGRSFTIVADIDIPSKAANGTIVALGSKFGGWSFRIANGRPVAIMATSQRTNDRFTVTAEHVLPEGRVKLEYDFRSNGGPNAGGELIIRADGKEVGRGEIARTISKLPEMTDTLDIGFDANTPIVPEVGSDHFSGHIYRVDIAPQPVAAAPHRD